MRSMSRSEQADECSNPCSAAGDDPSSYHDDLGGNPDHEHERRAHYHSVGYRDLIFRFVVLRTTAGPPARELGGTAKASFDGQDFPEGDGLGRHVSLAVAEWPTHGRPELLRLLVATGGRMRVSACAVGVAADRHGASPKKTGESLQDELSEYVHGASIVRLSEDMRWMATRVRSRLLHSGNDPQNVVHGRAGARIDDAGVGVAPATRALKGRAGVERRRLSQGLGAAGRCLLALGVHAAKAATSRVRPARLPWGCAAVGTRDKQTGDAQRQ